jgi:BirA family transcriptional regulator, biotin operon repressor / biotin---[acetyl-CoA-carboxylase] ligase
MDDFNPSRYLTFLGNTSFGREIVVFPELESTNTWLKSGAAGEALDGLICLTDRQIKGRGQYEKSWVSEPCSNLTWSYLLRPETQDRLFILTLSCIHAVANVIEREFQLKTKIKWPNDLIIEGKKVAGVLAEAVFMGNHLDRFIVGIGLNVNQSSFPSFLTEAASLSQILGRPLDREKLLASIVTETEILNKSWMQKDPNLVKAINQRLIGYGTKVGVDVDGVKLDGPRLLLGVNVNGHLHLMDDDYSVQTYAYEQVRLYVDPS